MTRPAPPQTAARLAFTYPGEIVPYVRVGQERWTPRARRYFASKDNLGLAVKLQMQANGWPMLPPKTPFVVSALFWRRRLYTADVDNLVKAALDALQGIVFEDDRYCLRVEAEKRRGGADFMELEIEEVVE